MAFNTPLKIIALMAIIIFSFVAGMSITDKASIEKKGYDAGYIAAWDKATKLVDSSTTPIFPTPEDMLSISGTVKTVSLSGNLLTIDAIPVSMNPLSEDSKPTVRTVKITQATEIVKMTAKTPEEIQATIGQGQPSMPFSVAAIPLSQLKEGDRVTITSDKDIKRETEITALKIALQ